jgi:pyrimidine-nucleoside phosphorylase
MGSIVELIAKKRDGEALSNDEVARVIQDFTSGAMTDYQMTALLMAIFFRGMTDGETVALTNAMLHSGEVLDLSRIDGKKVDKHSTGGVGDKVSICLAPLVAACGVRVPMISGRGLGHTGGTLDKLEAIPGFSVNLSTSDFERIVRDVGTSMIGQTATLAPADKRIYALRDVSATVESIPLIVASILSKKLAEGIDALVLDVKVGRGAFMKSIENARALATALVRVGTAAGKKVVALLTDMGAPLGRTIGNANETREAIEVLHGKGPEDLIHCTLKLGAEMLVLGDGATSLQDAETKLRTAISSGRGIETMAKLIAAHGGDARVAEDPSRLEMAANVTNVTATSDGFVTEIDALELGLSGVLLGAGRSRADQKVDHAVGIDLLVDRGQRVARGDLLCKVITRNGDAPIDRIRSAFRIGESNIERSPLVLERIA